MDVLIASDHAALALKSSLIKGLSEMGHRLEDLGPQDDTSVDYPDYATRLCQKLTERAGALGILICGSGIGMSIAANKHKGIRAALVCNTEMARLAKAHNNANVLCLGARGADPALALDMVQTWLVTHFEGGRHARRVDKLSQLDQRSTP